MFAMHDGKPKNCQLIPPPPPPSSSSQIDFRALFGEPIFRWGVRPWASNDKVSLSGGGRGEAFIIERNQLFVSWAGGGMKSKFGSNNQHGAGFGCWFCKRVFFSPSELFPDCCCCSSTMFLFGGWNLWFIFWKPFQIFVWGGGGWGGHVQICSRSACVVCCSGVVCVDF